MNKKTPPSPQNLSEHNEKGSNSGAEFNRRSFLKNGAVASAALTAGAGFLGGLPAALAEESHGGITRGDAALLRFAAAAEILETDFWVQYNELGGVQDDEVPG